MKRKIAMLLAVIMGMSLLSGCGGGADTQEGAAQPQESAVEGGENVKGG